eukprot:1125169-Prymnesium_polylepis.1
MGQLLPPPSATTMASAGRCRRSSCTLLPSRSRWPGAAAAAIAKQRKRRTQAAAFARAAWSVCARRPGWVATYSGRTLRRRRAESKKGLAGRSCCSTIGTVLEYLSASILSSLSSQCPPARP